ncbi:MAG: glycosyltransferase [Actinobacteria bacterium]|nr:glycosyltransferase [Actinomycetota bacterium]
MPSDGDSAPIALLNDLAPSATASDLVVPLDAGWSLMNPTIASVEGGFKLIARSINWVNDGGHYRVVDSDGVFRTRNFLLDADDRMTIVDSTEMSPMIPVGAPVFPSHVVGLEDCRLIRIEDAWYAVGAVRDRSPDRTTQMALVRIDGANFGELITLPSPRPGHYEKNWMPFEHEGALHFVYSCAPTVILRCDPVTGSLVTISTEPGPGDSTNLRMRGGSQGVDVGDGWLFVVHELTHVDSAPRYEHRFIHLDRSFVIDAVSPPFHFEERAIEFCAGLALSGTDLLVTYGVADRRAGAIRVALAEVLAMLEPTGLKVVRPTDATPEEIDPQRFFELLRLVAEPEALARVPVTFGAPTAGPPQPRRTLTVAMATYDDFDGVYFTVQALRLFHADVLDRISILVLDNNPSGLAAPALKSLESNSPEMRYVPCGEIRGTSVRDLLFKYATSDWVMVVDSHVLLPAGVLSRLLDYIDANPDSDDLLQGPAMWDSLNGNVATHFEPGWSAGMYGSWASDERGVDPDSEPFDIPMQGLGCFVARRESWLGFNPRFTGFGGEEGYIHEKYRNAGRRTLCLPFLRWVHRFDRPLGTRYVNRWEDRIANYLRGWREVGLDEDEMLEHFRSLVGATPTDGVVARLAAEEQSPFAHFDAIFCINLDERTDRWSAIQRQFGLLGITERVQRLSAVRTEHNHHIGCALSHRRAIELAHLQGLGNVLVLEDDVQFLYDTQRYLPASITELAAQEWDLLYLGGHRWDTRRGATSPHEHLEVPESITTTHAIAYNSTMFERLLGTLPESLEEMHIWQEKFGAIDQYLLAELPNLRTFVTVPAVATQGSIIAQEDPLFADRYMP